MAFNSIWVSSRNANIDASLNKGASLASINDFAIKSFSNPIEVREPNAEAVITHEVQKLPERMYLLRGLNRANNEKQEHFGHSLIFFKAADLLGLYDPSVGMTITAPNNLKAFTKDSLHLLFKKMSSESMQRRHAANVSFLFPSPPQRRRNKKCCSYSRYFLSQDAETIR